jgi:hypothetical protein
LLGSLLKIGRTKTKNAGGFAACIIIRVGRQ